MVFIPRIRTSDHVISSWQIPKVWFLHVFTIFFLGALLCCQVLDFDCLLSKFCLWLSQPFRIWVHAYQLFQAQFFLWAIRHVTSIERPWWEWMTLPNMAKVDWIGASIVLGGDKEEALCLSLGPCEAYCVVLPPPTSEKTAAPLDGSIFGWFQDEQNLCLTANAKELVAAFLKRGIDVQCSLAEPRIAHWLLDPDDKQNVAIANLAAACQISLESNGATLVGNSSSLSAVLRARLASSWPEAFVVLPLLAELLRRLGRQQLLGSFWWIEMPLATVLAWMEHFGIGCQTRDPNHTRCHVLYKMAAIQENVKKVVGRQVLLNSSEDVGRALFEDLHIPVPRGAQMRRKANGRLCYKSPQELLKRLLPNQVVSLILEYRQLVHAVKRIETIQRSAEAPRMEPLCPLCVGTLGASSSQPCTGHPFSQPRIRTDFVQTATATGRLATATGAVLKTKKLCLLVTSWCTFDIFQWCHQIIDRQTELNWQYFIVQYYATISSILL